MTWLYGFGCALIHGSYVDLMRTRGSAQVFNLVFELLAALSYLVFLVWGFFVFEWWVPLLMPVLGSILAVFVNASLWLSPHLTFLLGFSLCCFALLTY